jgi:hypothetical protein
MAFFALRMDQVDAPFAEFGEFWGTTAEAAVLTEQRK